VKIHRQGTLELQQSETRPISMPDDSTRVLPILLGSGVSCAGRLPGIGLLSNIAGEAFRTSKEEPLFGAVKGLCEEDRGGLSSNYEDWLYVTIQLRDHVLRDYENPGLIPLLAHLVSRTGWPPERLKESADVVILSVLKTVCSALRSKEGVPEAAYPKLAESLASGRDTAFRFFTLNHDLLLERYFYGTKVSCYDGFEMSDELSSGRRFGFDRTKYHASKVSLLKLHGSMNWWRHRPLRDRGEENPWINEFIGVDVVDDRTFERIDETPLILAGTFNKILQYSSPVFLQLLAEFHHTLQRSDSLLVCGYGFGDKGINSIIADWMCGNLERHLLVVDPEPFDEKRARGAILWKVDAWRSEERLHVFSKGIGEGFAWDEILSTALQMK
jgi:hypothetical protein